MQPPKNWLVFSLSFFAAALVIARASLIQSTWNGGTNVWTAAAQWQHSPDYSGFPNDGVNQFFVTVPAGRVTIDAPVAISSLAVSGGGVIEIPFGTGLIATQFEFGEGSIVSGSGALTTYFGYSSGCIFTNGVVCNAASLTGDAANAYVVSSGCTLNSWPWADLEGVVNFGSINLTGAQNRVTSLANWGTLRLHAGESFGDFDLSRCTNNGRIEARPGIISLSFNESWNSGEIHAATGATLQTVGLTYGQGAMLSGKGAHHVIAGFVAGVITNVSDLRAQWLIGPGALLNDANGVLRPESMVCTITNLGTVVVDSSVEFDRVYNYALVELREGAYRGALFNAGELRVRARTPFGVMSGGIFENRALLSVEEGALVFLNGSVFTNGGHIAISNAGALYLSGDALFEAGTVFSGEGTAHFEGSSSLAGMMHLPPHAILEWGGIINCLSNAIVDGTLLGRGGLVTGPADLTVASNGVVDFATCHLSGPGTLRVEHGGSAVIYTELWGYTQLSRALINAGNTTISNSIFLGAIENDGVLTLKGSRLLGGLVNRGLLAVDNGAWSRINGRYLTNCGTIRIRGTLTEDSHQSLLEIGGEIILEGGVLDGNGNWRVTNGIVRGNGECRNVEMRCDVSPGAPIGELRFTSVGVLRGSRVCFDIAGRSSGEWDRITATEVFVEDGAIFEARLQDGFTPVVGDRFEVMCFETYGRIVPGALETQFPRFRGLTLANGIRLAPIFTSTNLVLWRKRQCQRVGGRRQLHWSGVSRLF